jgi:Spy/CpxP family protein refolding chaperone
MGALALGAEAIALAGDAPPTAHSHEHKGAHKGGLLSAALGLDSLTPAQRSSIEQLIQQRHAAKGPVRQADAQVLSALAQQVEQAKIDPPAIATSLDAEQRAANAEEAIEAQTLNQLHQLLTPAQRTALVDAAPAGDAGEHKPHGHEHGRRDDGLNLSPEQRAQIAANFRAQSASTNDAHDTGAQPRALLEAFRGDSFDAGQFLRVVNPGAHAERTAQAMVPVLTPAQRAILASRFRARAAHES